jgi:acetyltransferase-like isoleucine patch superfamily enzyme
VSLLQDLIAELKKARDEKRSKFNRVVPVGDLLSERDEKARYLGFGEGSTIYDSSLVFGDVRVGKNVWVGPFTILDGSAAPLIIGDHCNISAGVQIYTHDTVDRVINDGPLKKGAVTIGERVYIGPQTVIALGVTIGHHSVIGANSLVLDDIPPYTKAFGTPARPRGSVKT